MANYQLFLDQTSWTNALGGSSIVTEDFNNGASLHSGLLVFGGLYGMGDLAGFGVPGISENTSTNRFEFIPFITAMGGTWDLSPGGAGPGLELRAQFHSGLFQTIDFIINPVNPKTNTRVAFKGFWGFISDTPVQFVNYLSAELTGNGESFSLSNLVFVQSDEPRSIGTGRGKVFGGVHRIR
jgi:hypothetical protein